MAKWNSNKYMESDIQPKQKAPVQTSAPVAVAVAERPEINNVTEYHSQQKISLQETDGFDRLQNNLNSCLKIVDDAVLKNYLIKLENYPILPIDKSIEKSVDQNQFQFLRITKMVYEKDEFACPKLAAVFNVFSHTPCTIVLILQYKEGKNEVYLGVRNDELHGSTGSLRDMLERNLGAQFPGSEMESYINTDKNTLQRILGDLNTVHGVTSVSCVADYKQESDQYLQNKDFLQGLDKFLNSMSGSDYTAIMIAENVSRETLVNTRRGFENIYTTISPFANMQYNFSGTQSDSQTAGTTKTNATSVTGGTQSTTTRTDSDSYSTGRNQNYSVSEGTSRSMSNGTSDTKGTTDTTSDSVGYGTSESTAHGVTKSNTVGVYAGGYAGGNAGVNVGVSAGVNRGVNAGASYNHTSGTSDTETHGTSETNTHGTSYANSLSRTVSKTLTDGISATKTNGIGENQNYTKSIGNSASDGITYTEGESFSLADMESMTKTFGSTHGITLQAKNGMLDGVLKRIEKQIERINECESMGMWKCAAYFLGDTSAASNAAGSAYLSLMSGIDTGVETTAVNTWCKNQDVKDLLSYLKLFHQPKFDYQSATGKVEVDATNMISTNELALQMGLPRKSVAGFPVIEHTAFGQDVVHCTKQKIGTSKNNEEQGRTLDLGKIYHLGKTTKTNVSLDVDSLSMHTFVTGSTGAGKSNTVYHILNNLANQKVSFLVIEPAKGEYHQNVAHEHYYGTNPVLHPMLKINPFSFPKEIYVLEHIDRLVELFNVCWPMYAAMPAVLKDAIIRAYQTSGWDLDRSVNRVSEKLFPTFSDVLREIRYVTRHLAYSADAKSDYEGSLVTRLTSLTNGINGQIFSGKEISSDILFNSQTIVDISRIGSMETKSLLMGILIMKLQEFRMSENITQNSSLRHVTVLEEAHNLLKKTSTEQGQETANVQGKSVEMLTNAIAEMRTYGEGFIIADQAPNLLDTAVIRNTNTKIVFRLPEGDDREITGRAMALADAQVQEFSKLPTGVAAVFQNDWQEAVLCDLPIFKIPHELLKKSITENAGANNNEKNIQLLKQLLKKSDGYKMSEELKNRVLSSEVSGKTRRDLIANYSIRNTSYEWALADLVNSLFHYETIFEDTKGTWKTVDSLGEIMAKNVQEEFKGLTNQELNQVLYCICHTEHEKYPKNIVIQQVRDKYFRKWWCQS